MRWLWMALLLVATPRLAPAQPDYSDIWKSYYSHVVEKAADFPPGTPVDSTVTIPSPMGYGSVAMVSTDGVKVPYDQAEAHISITSKYFRPVHVRVRFFRTLNVTWITERTVLIDRDIGHIAAIEEILDVVDRRWLSQQSVSYGNE
ncbi:MAG: hypothetical protein ACM3JJ_09220 [Hyphomicrobiales bacterium]